MHLTITTWKNTVCVYYWIFTYCPPKIFYEFRINAFWTAFWILLSLCDDRLRGACGNCVFCQCHVMCNARPNFNLHAILSSNTWALFQHSNHQLGLSKPVCASCWCLSCRIWDFCSMCLYTSGVGTQNTLYWNRVYDPVLFENELVQRWMVLEMFLKKLSWAMII